MHSWDIRTLDTKPHTPQILSSSEDARAIVLDLPAGERLQDHEVHERAWLVVVDGSVEVSASEGPTVEGAPGQLFEFAAGERHEVVARSDARLLLLLTPWPGAGHPGAMTLEAKTSVRARAVDRRQK
jgi:quercetin dioxygenase-like cupin family protein